MANILIHVFAISVLVSACACGDTSMVTYMYPDEKCEKASTQFMCMTNDCIAAGTDSTMISCKDGKIETKAWKGNTICSGTPFSTSSAPLTGCTLSSPGSSLYAKQACGPCPKLQGYEAVFYTDDKCKTSPGMVIGEKTDICVNLGPGSTIVKCSSTEATVYQYSDTNCAKLENTVTMPINDSCVEVPNTGYMKQMCNNGLAYASTAVQVAVYVGVPVGAIALAIPFVIMYKRRKKRAESDNPETIQNRVPYNAFE